MWASNKKTKDSGNKVAAVDHDRPELKLLEICSKSSVT